MKIRLFGCILAALMVHVAAYGTIVVDDAFPGTALSSDWGSYTDGSLTVTNDQLTLDIGNELGTGRAYVRMDKSEFNFYETPLKVGVTGLDLRGVASSASQAIWYFFGIADKANFNQLHPNLADYGCYFAFRRILVGTNQIQQVYAIEKSGGVQTATVLGNISANIPRSLEISMDGNNWTMEVFSDEHQNLGPVVSNTFARSAGDFNKFYFVMGTCNISTPDEGGSMDIGSVFISAETNAPDTDLLVSDKFFGLSLTNWTAAGIGGSWTAAVSNGVVAISPGVTNNNYRAVIARNTDDAGNATNSSGKMFNFYTRPLSIHAAFGDFEGQAAASQVYYSLGICASSNGVLNMYPTAVDDGVFFAIKRLSVGIDQLLAISVKDGVKSETLLGNLSGEPTDMDVVVDGNDWSLELTGATVGGLYSTTGTFSSVSESDFADFYVAAASYNNGNTAVPGVFNIDTIEITAPSLATEPPPAPGLLSTETVAGGFKISWDAVAAGTYILQSRTNLVGGTWSNAVEGISGIDGVLSVTNDFSEPAEFFRVIVQ